MFTQRSKSSATMSSSRSDFYADTISAWIPDRHSTVLIVAGGDTDHAIFAALGFNRVTISNLDSRMNGSEFQPYDWRFLDAEHLELTDGSYDYVVVHAGLHHLRSPHRGLTEMYRVARKGVVFLESRDSLTMRLIERLNLTQPYEHAAVFYSEGKFGGVTNSEIPNYVYRWTEREVEKTISSYSPTVRHRFRYRYGVGAPSTLKLERGNVLRRLLVMLAVPAFRVFTAVFPRERNLFACFVEKPAPGEGLYPWLKLHEGEVRFNHEWADVRYKTKYIPPR